MQHQKEDLGNICVCLFVLCNIWHVTITLLGALLNTVYDHGRQVFE